MILSGDDLTRIPPERLAMLRKLLPPTATAAEFEDESLEAGRMKLRDGTAICIFNWGDAPKTITVRLAQRARVTEFWSGQDLGMREGSVEVKELPPHSARILVCRP